MPARAPASRLPQGVDEAAQLNFSANVPANDSVDVVREAPFDGEAYELLYGAAAGANNKVGVKLRYEETGEQKFPGDDETEYINLADVYHPFVLKFDIEEKREIKVVYENQDDEPHYLNVILTVISFEDNGGA